jgi:5-bromo-4-chloroindolyl phosphate hydrolysis protein
MKIRTVQYIFFGKSQLLNFNKICEIVNVEKSIYGVVQSRPIVKQYEWKLE